MKKTLLIGAAIAVGFSAFAQGGRQAANLKNKTVNKGLNLIDSDAFPVAGTKKIIGPVHTSAVCNPVVLTSGPNAFGVGGGVTTFQQNCLSYNQDLNSYVWTHRRSAAWPGSSSGSMQATWFNPTTMAKDSTMVYFEPTAANPGRYPSGSFYNPAGNTTLANTYVVSTGPDLVGNAGAFLGVYYATRQLTGNYYNFPPANQFYTASPSNIMGSTVFMNVDMTQVGTKVLVTGECLDTTTSGNGNHNTAHGVIIGKCDFSTGSPVWTRDSVVIPYHFQRDGAGNGYASSYGDGARMAFFGQTGYLVAFGRLATNYGNSADSMFSPIVYKSTDGGQTWNGPLLPGYDWRCKHPELHQSVGGLRPGSIHFMPSIYNGIDVTVDANGKLHLVTTFHDPYNDGASPDSLVFNYTYRHDYVNNHPIIWDLMTDGSDWKTMLVDSLITAYVSDDPSQDTTAAYSGIANGATFLPYGGRCQVSRSTDGTKIIYSWADSDPGVTGTPFNSQPDLWSKAYDITSGNVSASSNVTNGIGTCFFHMMADVSYFDAGASKWIAPMVYTLPRTSVSAGVYDGISVSDHIYVNCAEYTAAAFSTPAVINNESTTGCAIGIATYNNFVNNVAAYPNPSNGMTKFVVNLNEAKAININVFDGIGNIVYSKKVNGNIGENAITFDGTSLSAGVYYYTVTAGYEKVTKKLVIQK